MPDPTLLYCVGATKAGTSWLHNVLYAHPQAHVAAVKEAHYWDSFDQPMKRNQIRQYEARLDDFMAARVKAGQGGDADKLRYMTARIRDMDGLLEVLDGDRHGDTAYREWLYNGIGDARLVADITPSYGLLEKPRLQRMLDFSPLSKVLYLVRDPLARLWSHVRMQARRALKGERRRFQRRANDILRGVIEDGQERHIVIRGDYAAVIDKLRAVVPEDRLLVVYFEDMLEGPGLARICSFGGIDMPAAPQPRPIHAGWAAEMRDDLVAPAVRFLKHQYEWVARHVGPLPAAWQASLAKG